MAKEFSQKDEEDYVIEAGKSTQTPIVIADNSDQYNKFLNQRNEHRNIVCNFAIRLTWASFSLLVIIVLGQSLIRATINPNFQAISDTGLNIITVSVFGEAIGVVAIIANQIWNGNEFGLKKTKKKINNIKKR